MIYLSEVEKSLIPLAEYLGIPLIILTPLAAILFSIFKWIIPKIMSNSSKLTGRIVLDSVANLFGEGDESSIVKGIDELEVSKLIKNLPMLVKTHFENNNEYLVATIELMVLMSQAMMGDRFSKPENSELLTQIFKKGTVLLHRIERDKLTQELKEKLEEGEVNET